jgi:hypothetical protein
LLLLQQFRLSFSSFLCFFPLLLAFLLFFTCSFSFPLYFLSCVFFLFFFIHTYTNWTLCQGLRNCCQCTLSM